MSRIRLSRRRRGFTLVEVLATLMLMAIVLPAVMRCATLATSTATAARRRTEATGLAQAKLAQIVADGSWQGSGLAGDFGADWPDYTWQASVSTWAQDTSSAGLRQIDLRVTWMVRGRQDAVTLSTLTYARSQP